MNLSKRTIASRANGALSAGPKTEAGKRRSSMNAVRHGLLSKCVVLPYESPELFSALAEKYVAKLGPVDDVELACVEEMTAAAWRLRRLMAIETTLMTNAIGKSTEDGAANRIAGAFSQLSAGAELHLIDRYENRLHRTFQRSLRNFRLLREFGNADEEPEPEAVQPDAESEDGDPPDMPESPVSPAEPPEKSAPPESAQAPEQPAPPVSQNPAQPNEPRFQKRPMESEGYEHVPAPS